MILDECCTRCLSCGLTWCLDLDVSPGEAVGICRDCYDTENPEAAA